MHTYIHTRIYIYIYIYVIVLLYNIYIYIYIHILACVIYYTMSHCIILFNEPGSGCGPKLRRVPTPGSQRTTTYIVYQCRVL